MILLVAMAAAATLTATVQDESGSPVPGARVWAYGVLGTVGPVESDASGTARIAVTEGDWRLYTAAPEGAELSDVWNRGDMSACAGAVTEVVGDVVWDEPIVLRRAITATGRLLDGSGLPLAGVEVEATLDASLADEPSATTDEDGRFAIAGIPVGVVLSVRVGQYGDLPYQWLGGDYDSQGAWVLEDDTDLGPHLVHPGITLSGVVSGPDGPVSTGALYAYSGGQAVGVVIAEDGSYVARGLPPGGAIVWAVVDGLATTYYPGVGSPGASVDATQEGGSYVVDLSMPEEAELDVTLLGSGATEGLSGTLYNEGYTVAHVRIADEDGVIHFGSLWPGDWYLSIRGGGYVGGLWGGSEEPTPIAVERSAQVEVALEDGGTVEGYVVDELGVPVPTGEVLLTGTGSESALADEEGAWLAEGMPEGWHQMQAYGRSVCTQDPSWTMTWGEDVRTPELATQLYVSPEVPLDAGDLMIWRDADIDGMGDAWEEEHGLDTARNDSGEDADLDGYTNAREWQLDTDPTSEQSEGCACGSRGGPPAALGLLLIAAVAARRRR